MIWGSLEVPGPASTDCGWAAGGRAGGRADSDATGQPLKIAIALLGGQGMLCARGGSAPLESPLYTTISMASCRNPSDGSRHVVRGPEGALIKFLAVSRGDAK